MTGKPMQSGHYRENKVSNTLESPGYDINRPKESGTYYQATVPDTLDLVERAHYGINHFTSIISEENNYEMYWSIACGRYPKDIVQYMEREDLYPWGYDFGQTNPPVINFLFPSLMICQPKAVEAMAMERLMTGSERHLEREAKMLEMMASLIDENGLYMAPGDPKKWWLGPAKDHPYANTHGQARMIRAMIAWYQYTGNSMWKKLIDRMVDGLDRHLVVHKDGYAYVPVYGWLDPMFFRSCYSKKRGWKDATEPPNEKFGEEHSLFNHQGHTPGALANWYGLTGNEQALRLAGEMVRFYLKPKFWADWKKGEYPGVVGAEHAHWQGHFHGHTNTLRAILEYAIVTNDSRLKAFVRDGYEWARQAGIARIGLVGDGQGCGLGRFIGLAIKLTDAGVGDYWEDVDLYIRNQGIEMQFTPEDIPDLKKLSKGKPAPSEDASYHSGEDVYDMVVGGYSYKAPGKPGFGLCCSPHGNMGLFYAWEGTLRYDAGVAQVNLLLNRASPWIDVESYLPYQGKVLLRNKEAKEAFVRIPLWVDKNEVHCHVNRHIVPAKWLGRHLRLDSLAKGDVVTITFPVQERTEKWTLARQEPTFLMDIKKEVKLSCRFRGNTLVELSPPIAPDSPLFKRRPEKYKRTRAPMKTVQQYVNPIKIKW